MDRFQEKLESVGFQLTKRSIEILQVNLGKLCNMTCVHCHVEAGPTKTWENMNRNTAEALVRFMEGSGIKRPRCARPLARGLNLGRVLRLRPPGKPGAQPTVETLDLTGGAPELNPNFRYLVKEGRKRGMRVIDRCNLTVFYEKGMEDLSEYLAENQVEVVASVPCYEKENVDKQRGKGTFEKSIDALLWLNRLGYGKKGTGLRLHLVHNPLGPHLPPPQDELERAYKERLRENFGIVFNRLYTITNMPITRYSKYLKALGQYDVYVGLLIQSFNPATLEGLMCRNTLSVGWDGKLYDCDFNQMLGFEMRNGKPFTIFNCTLKDLENSEILTADHCFGCTAGCGSSCHGALA